ncbi:hypothetical protein [Pedobacter frigoris]|uniref:hypothetical protein n=1 Tax=Pedobacter frigoris TaxID=2571272 RepID=UPI00292DCC19|nr:hypothetical protein [Pedobacter frigoris]
MDFKNILLFKTDIRTIEDRQLIAKVMDDNKIDQWTIDQQDIDCVLRIVSDKLRLTDIIQLVSRNGYLCEELT